VYGILQKPADNPDAAVVWFIASYLLSLDKRSSD
jgi:hypothetical protein